MTSMETPKQSNTDIYNVDQFNAGHGGLKKLISSPAPVRRWAGLSSILARPNEN